MEESGRVLEFVEKRTSAKSRYKSRTLAYR